MDIRKGRRRSAVCLSVYLLSIAGLQSTAAGTRVVSNESRAFAAERALDLLLKRRRAMLAKTYKEAYNGIGIRIQERNVPQLPQVFETDAGRPPVRGGDGQNVRPVQRQLHGALRRHRACCATSPCRDKPREGIDFFPLSVDFEEKLYSVGRIPGSFMRREGRPGEKAILTSRVVDRPIRPLFPKDMRNDVSVVMTVMSVDQDCSPEIAGMIGTSIALSISDIPWNGPIARRVHGPGGRRAGGEPHRRSSVKHSDLQLTVAASAEKIVMIEAGANEVDERHHAERHQDRRTPRSRRSSTFINGIVAEIGKPKIEFQSMELDHDLFEAVKR